MDTSLPFIPEEITVHLGRPDESAQNVTVSFRDYIKNVASSEIYPTWEEQALRANILAEISFALNRVYLQYYRNRGYDFDITSSTAFDQKYIHGRDIFENVANLTDDMLQSYVRRTGYIEPLSAAFCNGTTVTCQGLSQWGSQNLAQQGYSYTDILKYYYGENIEIVTNVPIRGTSPSYSGTPLRLGSSGASVLQIQGALNRISRNYPAIPKIPALDGLFGAETESAVKTFQNVFDLPSDGIVGPATWYQIQAIYVAVTKLAELRSEGQRYLPENYDLPEVLSLGSSGIYVSGLQYMLQILSEFIPEIPSLNIDGQYGIKTRDAVLAYQRLYGLALSGITGKTTWDSILNRFNGIQQTVLNNRTLFPEDAAGVAVETIADLQRALNRVAPVFAGITAPRITGILDRTTVRAVSGFQNHVNLRPTGQMDAATQRTLRTLLSNGFDTTYYRFRQYPGKPLSAGFRDVDFAQKEVRV